jgi:Xaa-Pro aminopeptidase
MISERKIAASRSNGRKSRGPRTAAGKSSASRNALRHGLAAITRHTPTLFPDIERMAKAFCSGDTSPLLFEHALVIAENEIVLRCVRVERVAVIERLRDVTAKPLSRDNSLARAKARFRGAKLKYKWLVRAKAKNAAINNVSERNSREEQRSGAAQPTAEQKPIKSRDEFDAMRHAMPDLDRLVRYERRAWSRRKRAIRDFLEIKSRSDG